MHTNLLVIGASSRFLANSATRAGWQVTAIDLFGDQDLQQVCQQTIRIGPDEYPEAIPNMATRLPPGPVVFGGGLENHPAVLTRLAAVRVLAGTSPEILETVRQPAGLARLAAAAGWHFPETHGSARGLPTDGSFLCKPLASAGGQGISRWLGKQPAPAGHCWQRRVIGTPLSAALLIGRDGSRLLGLCRQFIGLPWCGPPPFGFCGGVELPLPVGSNPLEQTLRQLTDRLAGCGLRGLVGVDFILPTTTGPQPPTPTLIEINPRPTATLELLERRSGESLLAAHLTACGLANPCEPVWSTARQPLWSKAVLFARTALTVDSELDQQFTRAADRSRTQAEAGWPLLADRPAVGSRIELGRPILTLFAAAATPAASVLRLRRRAAAVAALLSSRK